MFNTCSSHSYSKYSFFNMIDCSFVELTSLLVTYYLFFKIVLLAFLIILLVDFMSVSFSHSSHRFITQSGFVLLASFNQFPTESCTYFDGSDLSKLRMGSAFSGSCFNISICLLHTPRGRIDSTENLRIFSSSLFAHSTNYSTLSSIFCERSSLIDIQAISRTPK
ncbi:hypothetical protein KQ1_03004 [Bacillus cereus BAG3O-1]|nr:hypothetical protein KQ1_03004 [Bacillus cereus BAG3O-1]